MKLTSTAFEEQGGIPRKYACDGENISPPLLISEVPPETRDLVLIVHDPDAPIGDYTHWVMWNIDPVTVHISEGEVPVESKQGVNGSGQNKYAGPCPPSGTHHYFFDLYAIDLKPDLPDTTDRKSLESVIRGHILAQTSLVGLYSKEA